jgi:1,2-diacylglycerol 3-alpha-glucosyltransferase
VRILIASQIYAPAANGQAVFTTQLAEGLAAAGHQVKAVIPSERWHGYCEDRNDVEIRALAAIPVGFKLTDAYFTPLPYGGIKRLLDDFRPDIVHIQDHYPLCRWIAGMAKQRRIPVVGTNHFIPENIVHYLLPFRPGRRVVSRILWWTMTSLYDRLDAVTTPTETAARILRQVGLRPPVQPISCGVNLHHYAPIPGLDRSAVRRDLGFDPDLDLLLYVGRIDEEKDLDVILRALTVLGEPVQLGIVGVGRFEAATRRHVKELQLSDRVVFTGFVSEPKLLEALQVADIFVMPSPAELQSIATLEAMAMCKPVVAARARALPELVDDGINGFLFEPGDVEDAANAIRRLLSQRSRWQQMGRASRDKVRPHHVESTIGAYQHLYRQVVRERRGARRQSSTRQETLLRP